MDHDGLVSLVKKLQWGDWSGPSSLNPIHFAVYHLIAVDSNSLRRTPLASKLSIFTFKYVYFFNENSIARNQTRRNLRALTSAAGHAFRGFGAVLMRATLANSPPWYLWHNECFRNPHHLRLHCWLTVFTVRFEFPKWLPGFLPIRPRYYIFIYKLYNILCI